ncbi:phage major capsid protein [Rothia sp. P3C3.S176]|uniref:phage major capsid protein n=1 Tax=Rothia sp. P3C3.S176 TaxID=2962204 RepID=UPI0020C8B83A|nr:phage major capsid protein [Rothia sp. P3C3.S176]MCP8995022.1 phage major capsid protein [Rothia sp. P3C3.S176]
MAVTKAVTTTDFSGFLKPEMAEAYFEDIKRVSAVQQMVRQVPLGASGIEVPVVTSKATAKWVAEGAKKESTSAGLGLKTMKPMKIAAIVPISAEVVRSNPGNFMSLVRDQVAEAIAEAFDAAVLHGTDTPFGVGQALTNTTKTVALGTATENKGGMFADLNSGLDLLVKDNKELTGFLFDPYAEPKLNTSVDTTGRPLFVSAPTQDTASPVRSGTVLSRPALFAKGVRNGVGAGNVVGFGGDFSKAIWGTVGGISYDVSTEATVTINGQLTSLWENNLVALRVEAEYGWLLHDKDAFVKYTIK